MDTERPHFIDRGDGLQPASTEEIAAVIVQHAAHDAASPTSLTAPTVKPRVHAAITRTGSPKEATVKAERTGDNITVTFTMEESHVIIWGGPQDVVDALNFELRHRLVDVEDKHFTTAEYEKRIDLRDNKLYEKLRESTATFRRETDRARYSYDRN